MKEKFTPLEAQNIDTYDKLFEIIAQAIKLKTNKQNQPLNILEAGCGRRWAIDLKGISYSLTGVDIDAHTLEMRKNKKKDLDVAIHADLLTAPLTENYYDVIFSYNMLEHIAGAETMLLNFIKWLNEDGIIILRFPNRDSARGFLTRLTPFWFHIFFKKYIIGQKNAGKPGFDPYPTVFDKIVSRKGIYEFCKKHSFNIKAEYRIDLNDRIEKSWLIWFLTKIFLWFLQIASFNKLTTDYYGLLYIIEKPKK